MDREALRSRAVTLDKAATDSRLEEYRRVRPDPGGDDLALLETSLFLEEALGIRLCNDEIIPENLVILDDPLQKGYPSPNERQEAVL